MKKITLTIELEHDEDKPEDFINGPKYADKIRSLHDEVFRPVIKYSFVKTINGRLCSSEDQEFYARYFWELCNEHFNEQ